MIDAFFAGRAFTEHARPLPRPVPNRSRLPLVKFFYSLVIVRQQFIWHKYARYLTHHRKNSSIHHSHAMSLLRKFMADLILSTVYCAPILFDTENIDYTP